MRLMCCFTSMISIFCTVITFLQRLLFLLKPLLADKKSCDDEEESELSELELELSEELELLLDDELKKLFE